MKTYILIASLSLVSISIASARIGENQTEITARFGAGKKEPKTHLPGTEHFSYTHENRSISIMFLNGKSVMEIVRGAKSGLSDEEIKQILADNGEGKEWQLDKDAKAWLRSDGKLKAFRSPHHPQNVLFIQDVAKVNEMDAKKNSTGGETTKSEKAGTGKTNGGGAPADKPAPAKKPRGAAPADKTAPAYKPKGTAGTDKPASGS